MREKTKDVDALILEKIKRSEVVKSIMSINRKKLLFGDEIRLN